MLQPAVAFADALRVFREWNREATPIEVSYRGKAGFAAAVHVTVKGIVVRVEADGIVAIAGEGREIELDLRIGELTLLAEAGRSGKGIERIGADSAFCVVYGTATCELRPRPGPLPKPARRVERGFRWWSRKPVRAQEASPVEDTRPEEEEKDLRPQTRRNLFVDVGHGQANIVEALGGENGERRFRRLKEQFLPQGDREQAERLKREIIFGENGGAYDLNGLYSPKTDLSCRKLAELVDELERRDGAQAWDRRRYTR